jgi:dienelactone hydrolase
MKLRRAIPRLLIPVLSACGAGGAVASRPAAQPTAEALRLFDYDARSPLGVRVVSTRKSGALTVQEITYASPKGGRVPATLLIPEGRGPFAGILFMHGMPGNRTATFPEAETLARRGAVTLSIDAPFARRRGEAARLSARDREEQVQLIVDWRRGVDLLTARPDVDPKRLAYVGHSYGGAMGGLLAGVEKRLKAYALVVGDGGLVSHVTASRDPDFARLSRRARERWLAAMEPIEPLRFVGRASPAHLLFQNGYRDRLVSPASAEAYQAAASEPKTVEWYDADHGLDARATRDRHLWLAGQIGIAQPD